MQNEPDVVLEVVNGQDTQVNGPEVRSALLTEGRHVDLADLRAAAT